MSYRVELIGCYTSGGNGWGVDTWLKHIENGNLCDADVMGLLAERDIALDRAKLAEKLLKEAEEKSTHILQNAISSFEAKYAIISTAGDKRIRWGLVIKDILAAFMKGAKE